MVSQESDRVDYDIYNSPGVPIKAWTRGVPVEDKALEQVRNTASLPIVHSHVALMGDCHWGQGATVGSVVATIGAVIPASVGVDIGCFVGETKVPLLDGTQATLQELADRPEPFWVYSVNADLRIAPGRATCRKTRTNAALIRVVVSGGDEVVCTPDHQFMMHDGSYREASALRFNDSLMPLYRRWQTRDGYESCSNGQGMSWQTHVMAYEALNGVPPDGMIIHHVNHSHFDNRPDNFELLSPSEHSRYHRAVGKKFRNADPEFQKRRQSGIDRRWSDPEYRANGIAVGTANITRYMREKPEHFKRAVRGNGKRGSPVLAAFNTRPRVCSDCNETLGNPAKLLWHKKREHGYNHKVILAEAIERRDDVYCLQVEGHHNFAIAAGVFVHNCGVIALHTPWKATDLPDSLAAMRSAIEAVIPHGRTNNGGPGDRGAWADVPGANAMAWRGMASSFDRICEKYPAIAKSNNATHLGTLGGGNHMVEVCLDETGDVWAMLHSGSRGVGNRIGGTFIELAKEDAKRNNVHLPDADLAYLNEGSEVFDDYVYAVGWAQDYARVNRELMLAATVDAMSGMLPGREWPPTWAGLITNCHHNYISREHHFGADVIVTRKGAVSARDGEVGLILGSMGTPSFVVRGKGNADSFHTCSHGAGRVMSRGEAKRRITLEDHAIATAGVECRRDSEVLDESPAAYKDILAVMEAQKDLVDVVHVLKQVLCVKG
jgi:tRNA-splicing ligase RtcB